MWRGMCYIASTTPRHKLRHRGVETNLTTQISVRRISAKLQDSRYMMNLRILSYVLLPSRMASTIVVKRSLASTTAAACLAKSVPVVER